MSFREYLEEKVKFKKYDNVRILSKNKAGIILKISGGQATVKTIKGEFKVKVADLELMPED